MQDACAEEAKGSKDGLAETKVLLKDLMETLRPMFGEWQKSVSTWFSVVTLHAKDDHRLTPLYAEYQSISTKSDRLDYLSKSLASLQLELDLLRAKYPHPRRTIDELEEHAQEQVEAIIALTEKKEQRLAELARKRKEVEEARKRVEKLRGKVEDMERKSEGVMKRKDTGESAVKADWCVVQFAVVSTRALTRTLVYDRLKQYAEYVQMHLPIRSLDRVSENELRIGIALPSGGQTTLSVVFHPLTGKLAKAEVRSISTPDIYTNVV